MAEQRRCCGTSACVKTNGHTDGDISSKLFHSTSPQPGRSPPAARAEVIPWSRGTELAAGAVAAGNDVGHGRGPRSERMVFERSVDVPFLRFLPPPPCETFDFPAKRVTFGYQGQRLRFPSGEGGAIKRNKSVVAETSPISQPESPLPAEEIAPSGAF